MRHLVVAPFWSDNDIRREGAVRYATYTRREDSALGETLLTNLTRYIGRLNKDPDFEGRWMLVAHWDGVHPSPHGGDSNNGINQVELDKVSRLSALFSNCCQLAFQITVTLGNVLNIKTRLLGTKAV